MKKKMYMNMFSTFNRRRNPPIHNRLSAHDRVRRPRTRDFQYFRYPGIVLRLYGRLVLFLLPAKKKSLLIHQII